MVSGIREYYEDLTPRERAAWRDHLKEFPPGDFLVQRQLAVIASMIASGLGGKPTKPSDFAPWLEWEEEQKESLESAALNAILDRELTQREANG